MKDLATRQGIRFNEVAKIKDPTLRWLKFMETLRYCWDEEDQENRMNMVDAKLNAEIWRLILEKKVGLSHLDLCEERIEKDIKDIFPDAIVTCSRELVNIRYEICGEVFYLNF